MGEKRGDRLVRIARSNKSPPNLSKIGGDLAAGCRRAISACSPCEPIPPDGKTASDGSGSQPNVSQGPESS